MSEAEYLMRDSTVYVSQVFWKARGAHDHCTGSCQPSAWSLESPGLSESVRGF